MNQSTRAILILGTIFLFFTIPLLADESGLSSSGNNQILDSDFLLDPMQVSLSNSARALVGRSDMLFDHARFTWDCSGTVMASLFTAGLDLRSEYGQADGNGVKRLHSIVQGKNLEYDPLLPETGDLIFFDNTYDKNNNLEWDDELTHVAIVVDVANDGTISYLHHDYRRGVVIAYMNLLVPDLKEVSLPDGSIKVLNSPLRMNKDRYLRPDKWLSSHLFRSFGRIRLYSSDSTTTLVQSIKNTQ